MTQDVGPPEAPRVAEGELAVGGVVGGGGDGVGQEGAREGAADADAVAGRVVLVGQVAEGARGGVVAQGGQA